MLVREDDVARDLCVHGWWLVKRRGSVCADRPPPVLIRWSHTHPCAAAATNALNLQQRRWVQILEAHGRSDLKALVEGVESVGELVDKTELIDASDRLKDQLVDMDFDAGA